MTENEIQIGILNIAKFMEWEEDEARMYMQLKYPSMGKIAYNEKWDLIMPVIDKIESLDFDVKISTNYCVIANSNQIAQVFKKDSKILMVFEAILIFLEKTQPYTK